MSATFEALNKGLDITGVNRYNPNNIPTLESCITAMIKENKYDKDILMTLLKLYQLNPTLYNEKFVCHVLLKTMMVFPRNDYALAKYLIDSTRIGSSDLRRIFYIGALLESCNFSLFWRILNNEHRPDNDSPEERLKKSEEVKQMIDPIVGFRDAVRNYACQVINVTFQRIEKAQLRALLGGINDSLLVSFAKAFDWESKSDDTYFIQNHEDKIKSRNIEEKLKFEQCSSLLKT